MGILWPHSNTVARTNADRRAPGAFAYFFEAGTTTPRTTFQDADLTTPHAHPVVADAYGRFPAVFIDFGSYRERVKTAGNTQLWDTDDIPNPAPPDATEGVPDEQLLQTGEVFFKFANGVRTGAVRANGRKIGNAVSGADERANADCEKLFIELYQSMDNTACPVLPGGRGANAAADFAANKTITLPDLRGRTPFGLETMGAAAAGRMSPLVPGYTASSDGVSGAGLPGYAVGLNTHTLTTGELASHTHGLASITVGGAGAHTHTATTTTTGSAHGHTINVTDPTHQHSLTVPFSTTVSFSGFAGTGGQAWFGTAAGSVNSSTTGITAATNGSDGTHTHTINTTSDPGNHTHTLSGNVDANGSGTAHNNVPNAVLGTWYIKL